MPEEVTETWHLCTEWALVEVERAMLKLVWEIDKFATPSGAAPVPEGWKLSVSRAGSTASTANLATDTASAQVPLCPPRNHIDRPKCLTRIVHKLAAS